MKIFNIFEDLLNWEPVAGYPIKDFDWIVALYIIGAVAATLTIGYFAYFMICKLKMSKTDEDNAKQELKDIKKMPKAERKKALKNISKNAKTIRLFNIIKKPVIIVASVGVVLGSLAGSILPIVWEPMMQALNKKTAGGSNDSEAAKLAIGNSKENIVTLEKEGAVLLKNHDNVLPLDKTVNNKINIFGASAFGMLYGGGGSGVFVTNHDYNGNDFHATKLEKALTEEGFEYNMQLYNLVANYYESKSYKITPTDYNISCQYNAFQGNTYDKNGNLLVDSTKFPYDNEPEASAYNQTYAGIDGGKTLLEAAKAYSDTALFAVSRAGSEDSDLNLKLCQLTDREKAMLTLLEENFDKVIFVINSGNAMELGELDNEKIDSVLWVGHPGLTGNKAVAKIISGEFNPSGKMVDTWAYDISKTPAFQSFGPDSTVTSSKLGKSIVEYKEGIYVGYRYYTTRAHTDPNFKYDDEVQYSFGEGYSYTTFDKYINDYTLDLEHNKISVQVAVKNTGERAGKEVVELYLTAPYTPGGLEKSYVELVGYAKTNELAKNDVYNARINIDLEQFATWDSSREHDGTVGAYVLEKGDYEITLRENCWKIVDTTEDKNTIKFTIANDVVFTESKTGNLYENHLQDVEFGPHTAPITYLSRNDWAGTLPKFKDIDVNDISNDARENVSNPSYNYDNKITGDTRTGVKLDKQITIRDMKDCAYDDPRWDDFLAQLTESELVDLVDNGGFQTAAIKSIDKRSTYDDDGPASIQVKGTGYTGEVAIASSWNNDVATLMGESIGREGAAMGLTGWYAPGMNMHRCPTGGRNFEYYSEDPLIAGNMGGYVAQGTAKYGVYTYAKHICLNEQEQDRQNLTVWCNEQGIRQIYLRAYEIYVYLGGKGFMSSFSRVGSKWSGAQGFIKNICRNEWGFNGVVITDWINNTLMPVNAGLRGGNDLWLLRNSTNGANKALSETPNDTIRLLKESAHHILWVCANSNCVWTEEEYAEKGVDVDFSQMGYENI